MKKASGIGSLSRVATVQRSITHDALEIAFDESGTGRPVVWLHGISEDRLSWAPVTEQLADEMRCIRIDFRGHGATSHRRPYELEALVSDVTSVISATCNEPPVVVGHSLGGMVATIAAAIGDTGPVICVDQPLTLEGFAEIVHSIAPRLRDPETYSDALMEEKLAIGMGLVPQPLFRELERKTRASDQNVVLDIWKPMLDWDLGAMEAAKLIFDQLLRTINVPYLALHGQPVKPGYEEWFRSTNPAATIEFWIGMGHWLHLVDPVRFANRIRDFLSQRSEG
jgi:pimeloyl-ACP methyl ester carboxylesterase